MGSEIQTVIRKKDGIAATQRHRSELHRFAEKDTKGVIGA
jgi:hypothetical protein